MTKSRNFNLSRIRRRLIALVKQPIFILVTILGNSCLLISAGSFYMAESGVNPSIDGFLDCLVWTFSLVTGSGVEAAQAITSAGKVISIFTMMAGSLFLWTYMALFISALVSPELVLVEREIKDLETNLSELKKEVNLDIKKSAQLRKLITEVKNILDGV